MFGILFRAEIKPEKREDFINFIKWDIQVAKDGEPGTIGFDMYQDDKDYNAFFVYEEYRDEPAFKEHQKNEPFQRWDSDIKRSMLKRPHQELFKGDAVCSLATNNFRKHGSENKPTKQEQHIQQDLTGDKLMDEINWEKNQWEMMAAEIKNEMENSCLAQKIFTKVETLPPEARTASRDQYDYAAGTVDESHEKISDSTEPVYLTKEQTEDKDLSTAKMIVRRKAQELARKHDDKVFVTTIRDSIENGRPAGQFHPIQKVIPPNGDGLVQAVAGALAALEVKGYRSGFVMVAGHDVYTTIHERVGGAADLPRKAIEGLLENGPIHRSSVLPANEALVLSLSGEEIDRAVGVGPMLEFRRIDANDVRELRLYERFVPRFKQTLSVVLLQVEPKAAGGPKPK